MRKEDYIKLIKVILLVHVGLIGNFAVKEANKVAGLRVGDDLNSISLDGDYKVIINNLLERYEQIFGKTSIEYSKDAQRKKMSNVSREDLPQLLQ